MKLLSVLFVVMLRILLFAVIATLLAVAVGVFDGFWECWKERDKNDRHRGKRDSDYD